MFGVPKATARSAGEGPRAEAARRHEGGQADLPDLDVHVCYSLLRLPGSGVAFPVFGQPLDHVGVAQHGAADPGLKIEADLKWLPGARGYRAAVSDQGGLR